MENRETNIGLLLVSMVCLTIGAVCGGLLYSYIISPSKIIGIGGPISATIAMIIWIGFGSIGLKIALSRQ